MCSCLGDASELSNIGSTNQTWISHPFGIDISEIMPLNILSKEY